MQKKKLLTILGVMLAVVVASLSLVFTVGPMVSADDDGLGIMELSIDENGEPFFDGDRWAFFEQYNRVKIVVPEGVTYINGYEYDGSRTNFIGCSNSDSCEKVVSIVLPSTLIRIGVAALSNFPNVTSIEIPEGVTSIKRYAFSGCGITNLQLPSTLISIDEGAFEGCHNLATVFIPKSVTEMVGNVFYRGDYGDYSMWPEITYYLDSLSTIYCETESKPAGWDNNWLVVDAEPYNYMRTHEQETVDDVEVVWGYKPQGANNNENQNSENQNHENENNVTETNDTVVNDNRGNEVKVAAVAGTTGGIAGIGLGTVGTVLGFVIAKKRRK